MSSNSVELLGYYGNDETHALSAWTSTSRDLTDDKRGRIDKLLKMLASNGHHTPFEKSSLHFLVTTDIASHIHILKHRIGVSVNAESARYRELKDDRLYEPVDWPEALLARYRSLLAENFRFYHETVEKLEEAGFTRSRAKESARFALPYGTQITADVMFNFRSFMHFVGLRADEHAQLEIRNIAKEMLWHVEQTGAFPFSLAAFNIDKVS